MEGSILWIKHKMHIRVTFCPSRYNSVKRVVYEINIAWGHVFCSCTARRRPKITIRAKRTSIMTPITTTMMILHRTTIRPTITWRLTLQNRLILPKTRPYRHRLPNPKRSPTCREASAERKWNAKRTRRSTFETSRDVFCNERGWNEAGICRFIACNQIRGRLKNKYHRLDNRNLKASNCCTISKRSRQGHVRLYSSIGIPRRSTRRASVRKSATRTARNANAT